MVWWCLLEVASPCCMGGPDPVLVSSRVLTAGHIGIRVRVRSCM
jgi:hypothetical protein